MVEIFLSMGMSIGIAVTFLVIAFTVSILRKKTVPTIQVPLNDLEASEEVHVSKERSDSMAIHKEEDPNVVHCYDPATGCSLGVVKAMDREEVYRIAAEAKVAQKTWATTSFEQRRQVLLILQKYILQHQKEICRVDSRDSGKPLVDALLGEIITTCEKISYVVKHGEEALQRQERPTSLMTIHKKAFVEYHPLGVIGVIAPWNYPFHNLYNHIISGIFAGNGVVVKVSEYTSWSSSYFLRIVHEALRVEGHDPSLVQVVTGFGGTGAALVDCPDIDKILFTGSPQIGKLVMEGASKHLKPVVLELGGKDPMVILEDAEVDACIPIAMRGTFQNSGQNCCGIERIIIHERLYDEFVRKVAEKVKVLRQGPALSEDAGGSGNVDVSAMVTPQQLDIIQSLVNDAVERGAKLLAGGKRNETLPNGLFYLPTVLADVTPDMRIAKEEVFGPVMTIFRVKDAEEALRIVNDSDFGLGSCVFCKSDSRGEQLGQRIRAGMTCVNDFATNYLVQSLPFGGVKHSGFGRFAGPEGLQALCLQKSVVLDQTSFIRTTIPKIMQYPLQSGSLTFGTGLVSLIYGLDFSTRLRAIFSLINPK